MIEDKLVFLFFSQFFQTNELLLITIKRGKRGLVNNCQLVSRVIEINVTQTMIIHKEGSVWFQKNWHLGVIWVWNWFSVQCFLNCSQQIPLSAGFLGCITNFIYCHGPKAVLKLIENEDNLSDLPQPLLDEKLATLSTAAIAEEALTSVETVNGLLLVSETRSLTLC